MRHGIIAAALAALLTPAAASAADPLIVYQAQPLGQLLGEYRRVAFAVGGDKAVKGINHSLRQRLGDKGFDGLDLDRPILGYVMVPADPLDTVAVVALPVTTEKEFLDLCERANKQKPTDRKNGLYELPPINPALKALVRVVDGYAYIATGIKAPADALDPKTIVPAAKLADPAELSLVVARLHFDRLAPGTREALATYLNLMKLFKPAGPGFGRMEQMLTESFLPRFADLGKRYLDLTKGAKELTVRLDITPATELRLEAVLTPAPGSPLAKVIAEHKPTTNKFAGLLTPDTAVGFKTRLPLFAEEIREACVSALEAAQKEAAQGAPAKAKALLDELFKGLIRTAKTGEADIVGAVRGPDKDGRFTGILAVAFEDPSGLEKAVRKMVEDEPEAKKAFTWDVAKAGTVSIHQFKPPSNELFLFFLGRAGRGAFGENATVAFAFAPHGVVVAYGPDPVPVVKGAVGLKPAPSPVLDVAINPARLAKLAGTLDNERAEAEMVKAFGKADQPVRLLSLAVEGGQALRVTAGLSLRMLQEGFFPAPPEPAPAPS